MSRSEERSEISMGLQYRIARVPAISNRWFPTTMLFRLIPILFLQLAFPMFAGAAEGSDASRPPNIVLIMADDMGWSDIGCYGGEIETPNIDRLAEEGLQFLQFYNNAKCTTTRASLMTGLYPRNGGRGIELIGEDMVTLAEALGGAGYATGMSGKWHNGSKAPHRPVDRGFDESYGLWDGCSNFFDPSRPDPDFKGNRVRFFGENDERITEFPEDFYTTRAFTDHAVETIRKHVGEGRPFFHYIAHTAPHYPLHALPEDIARFEGRYDEGWDVLREKRYRRQLETGLLDREIHPLAGPNPNYFPWDSVQEDMRDWELLRMEVYAAMVYRMDLEIGRVLDLLDELGVAENTIVMFLSDNGSCAETPGGRDPEQIPGPEEYYTHCGPNWAYAQNTPFRRYKATTWEGGVATPFVVRWPSKIEAGARSDQVGHIIDLMPTFLEAAGGEYPDERKGVPVIPAEGISLLPNWTDPGQQVERSEPLYWFWARHRGLRSDDWKLVWERGDESWRLFNLATDRTETRDIAAEHGDLVERLASQWREWADLTGVKLE